MFQFTNIAVILFITTALNLVVTLVAWWRRRTRISLYFALGMTSLTFWTLTVGLGYAAVPLELKILFAKLDAVGYHSALVLLLLCVMYYAGLGKWADRRLVKFVLFLLPSLSVSLIVTNELHGWVWQGFRPVENNVVVFEHGPGFTWVAIIGYILIVSMIGILIWLSRRGPRIQQRQSRLLLAAGILPLAANTVYLYWGQDAEGVDWSSVTFSATALIFIIALQFTRFIDIIPIARDKLVEGLSDGMIVLDMEGRVIDINQPAAKMMGLSSERLIGRNLDSMVPFLGSLSEWDPVEEIRTELEVGRESKRYFDVLFSPLREKGEQVIGRLLVFRDITGQKQASIDLERRYLEIQGLHQDLQVTQAQLVEQQRTLATMEERQRLARDLHDSVNQSIHGMVLFADTLAATLEKGNVERARQIMDRLRESANQSLRETRLLLYELQESGPERSVDLIRDLEDRLAMVEGRVGVRTRLIQEGSLEYCPSEWKENLFWIAVEALNNSLKHAQSRQVQIVIRCTPERLELEVTDNGIGFDPQKVSAGGFGLKNLRRRADIIGGRLSIESEPSKGTTVRFRAEIGTKPNEKDQNPDC